MTSLATTFCIFLILTAAPLMSTGNARAAAADPEFGSYWHDGKAELDGYRLEISRYGQPRKGQAVLIYVTEPFSKAKHVNPGDTFDVLKLNLVRDFQTGIYDYNTMVSLFVSSNDFAPVKLAFTSAEWCGQVYNEMIFGADRISERLFSYFEDETSESSIERKPDGIAEDNLFVLLRGLRGAFLPPNRTRSFPFLPSPFHNRMAHRAAGWTTAEIERLASPETIRVPAGSFATDVYVVRVAGGREGRFHIERAYPHRVVRWTWKGNTGRTASRPGALETGELAGTARLQYWKLNGNGNESYLARLGLSPVVR